MRSFLHLYFLLVLPLLLMALLPKNPISMIGSWWFEEQAQQEYGAIYPLILEELEGLPQNQWQNKVAEISEHFAYSLEIQTRKQSRFTPDTFKRLDRKGYAVTYRDERSKLVHKIKDTQYVLISGLYDYDTDLQVLEKQTRGFRYLVNKKALQSNNPEEEFARLAHYFQLDLSLLKPTDFAENSELIQSLHKTGLFAEREGSSYISYH